MFGQDQKDSAVLSGSYGEYEYLDFAEEESTPDRRFILRPSEVVQSKLLAVLPRGTAVPVSSMHDRRFVRR